MTCEDRVEPLLADGQADQATDLSRVLVLGNNRISYLWPLNLQARPHATYHVPCATRRAVVSPPSCRPPCRR